MEKIIGVYNANGGLIGELQYVVGKIIKKKHCSLCDITHGFSIKAKDTWVKQVESFPIKIETKHLNELDSDILSMIRDNVPCVIHIDNRQKKIIMNERDLLSCDKDPDKFFELLKKRL